MGTLVNGIYVPDAAEVGWGDEVSDNHRRLADLGVNVRAYGAVGDGTTDDTAAINAALAAMGTTGKKLFFPWTAGGYKFGALTWPTGTGSTDKWVEIEVHGKLIPTATMNIPARRFSIIGRSGAVWNQFHNYPAAEIDGSNISSGRVVELSGAATSIYLEGLSITNVNGTANGIEADHGVTEVRLRGVHVAIAAGNTTGNCWRSFGGFGFYFEHCSFTGLTGGGKTMRFESTADDVPRIIRVRDSFIATRGILLKSSVAAEGTNYLFDGILAEDLAESFLEINSVSSAATFSGITLRQIKTDDATQSPHCLIKNVGTKTHQVNVEGCSGYSRIVETGSDRINGLMHSPGDSTTITIGQDALYEYRDKFGRHFFNVPRADVMWEFTSGTTPDPGASGFLKMNYGSPTTITDFVNEVEGQILEMFFTNGNVTIAHGTPIKLAGGVNFVASANDTLRLRSDGTTWYEVCRSVNG